MKKINTICSGYLFLGGLISIYDLFIIVLKNDISNLLVLFSITLICLGIITSVVNNFYLVRNIKNIQRKNLMINLILCLFQVVNVCFDGFQFKYNQGIEVNIYVEVGDSIGNFKMGAFLGNFNLALVFDFLKTNYSRVEINLLALLLTVFYLFQCNKKPSLTPPL